MALAKQFEYRVVGRGVLVDPTLPATPSNLSFLIDYVVIDGTSYPVAMVDATSVTAIQGAVETVVAKTHKTQQTITIASCTVNTNQTVTISHGDLVVTYKNTGGAVSTAAGLGAALKAALDADTRFGAQFDTAHSSGVLTITQKGDHTKGKTFVVGGTGTVSATVA